MTEGDLDRHARAAETKKRRSRQRITEATLNLFDPSTAHTAPTLEQIAEEAGVGVATLYSHFNTKYDLYFEVLTQLFDPLIRPIRTAVELNAYKPADLRAEIVSYVCRAAMLARSYRYLVAAYIQSYFENRQYDSHTGRRVSQPVADGLGMIIRRGHEPFDMRFRPYGIDEQMENLLLTTCMRIDPHGSPYTTRKVARTVLLGLLPSVDQDYTRDDIRDVVAQIETVIPKEEYDN